MKIQKLQQIIKEEYVDIMLNKKINEATINLTPEEMDKLHSNGSVNVGEDTVTYEEPENPTPVTEGNNTQYAWSQINNALMKYGMSPAKILRFLSVLKRTNEGKLTEAKSKKVTKQMWVKMSEYQRMDALLTVVKDPNKAEKFLDKKWNQLPSGFERDMYTEAYEPPKKKDGTVDWDAIANDPKNLHKNPKKGFHAKHLKQVEKLLKIGTKVTVKLGEDKLYKYAMEFERWNADNDDKYDNMVDPLFIGVELLQDKEPKEAMRHLKQFNKNCVKALKGKWNDRVYNYTESVNEAKLPKRFTVKTKQTIDGTIYSPGDYALKKKRAGGGIYLNMDKGEMLGVDAMNISKLEEGKLNEIDFKDTIGKAIKNPTKIVSNIEQLLIKKGKKNRNKKITWKDVQVLQDKLDDIGVNASISYDRIARELEYDLDEGKLREMIYSELFNVLREDSEKEDKKDILLGKKYEAIDLGKVFKKGKVKATYAGRKVEINREGKNPKDWTITFVDTGKTVPFIDGIANLTLEVSAVKGKISPSGKTGVKKVKKFTNKLKKVFGMLGV